MAAIPIQRTNNRHKSQVSLVERSTAGRRPAGAGRRQQGKRGAGSPRKKGGRGKRARHPQKPLRRKATTNSRTQENTGREAPNRDGGQTSPLRSRHSYLSRGVKRSRRAV